MEKTLHFSVFKEKIIKTNELLNVLLEKNKSLEQSQKWIQHLKRRLELNKNEVGKLKLRNETLMFNLSTVEKNYDLLKKEQEKLQEQFSKLQDESNNTINNLHMNYQSASQELRSCKQQLHVFLNQDSESNNLSVKDATIKRSPVKTKKSPVQKKDDKDVSKMFAMLNVTISELKAQKEKLVNEKTDLKLEVYELKKKIESLQLFHDVDYDSYTKMKDELEELKNTFTLTVETKDKEIEQFAKQLKIIEKQRDVLQADNDILKIENSLALDKACNESEQQALIDAERRLNVIIQEKNEEVNHLLLDIKNVQTQRDKLKSENEKLKQENCSYKLEIAMLQTNETISEAMSKQPDDLPLKENVAVNENQTSDHREIIPTDEEIWEIMKYMVAPARVSPINEEVLQHEKRLSPVEYHDNRPPSIIDLTQGRECSSPAPVDLKTIVNRRRKLLKKRRQTSRRKVKPVDLYGALLALKRANINFVISNSWLPYSRDSSRFRSAYYSKNTKFKYEKKKLTVTKELTCTLSCCKNTYMVLKGKNCGEDAQLLGFVDVKDEKNFKLSKTAKGKVDQHFDHVDVENVSNCDNNRQERIDNTASQKMTPKKSVKYKTCGGKSSEVVHTNNIVLEDNSNCEAEVSVNGRKKVSRDARLQVDRRKRKTSSLISILKKKPRIGRAKSTLPSLDRCDPEEEISPHLGSPESNTVQSKLEKSVDHSSPQNIRDDVIFKKPKLIAKSPKTAFKRPICSTRRSPRLALVKEQDDKSDDQAVEEKEEEKGEEVPQQSPQSPTPENQPSQSCKPVLIPLEKCPESVTKMQTTKIEVLFNKLILYSKEEEALNEIVREFAFQEPAYIAEAILERIAVDYHDSADTKYSPAPLMTHVQRTMLGFMSKLEKNNVGGVFDSYLTLAEQRLLTTTSLLELGPITRLYLAVCKLRKNLTRMRKLCCDVFYFCGEYAVPFLFIVLTSWTEVLPHAVDAKNFPLARVLVQIVYTIDCNKPGYNFLPLRDLLIKFYGYPTERWDHNEFFIELFNAYLKNPVRSSDFALLLYCKSRPENWVYEKIEEHLKPLINMNIQDNFKATLIILIGNLYNRFSSKSEVNYLPRINEWLRSLVTDKTPDVVKRCVYICLNRLKKK